VYATLLHLYGNKRTLNITFIIIIIIIIILQLALKRRKKEVSAPTDAKCWPPLPLYIVLPARPMRGAPASNSARNETARDA